MGCFNSIVVNAPADLVWNTLIDFHDMSWSKNTIEKLTKVGEKSFDQIGAKRILNDVFHETLLFADAPSKKIRYSIDDGPGPVSSDSVTDYIGEVTVIPVTANTTSFVLWTSKWTSAKNDVEIEKLCDPIYEGILEDLKLHFS